MGNDMYEASEMMDKREDSFSEFVCTHFGDEVKDCGVYLDIAQEKYNHEQHEMAYWFAQMAKDEFSHATYLRHVATICNIGLAETDVKCYHEMEYRLETIFR